MSLIHRAEKKQFETTQEDTNTQTIQLKTVVRTSMMTQEITMTTDSQPQKVTAANLYEPNSILNLTPDSGFTQPIAAVSFVTSRKSFTSPWPDVLAIAIGAATEYLAASPFRDNRWLFFGASDMWRMTILMQQST